MDELKAKGLSIRKYFPREEIDKLAQNCNKDLTYEQQEVVDMAISCFYNL